MYRITTDSPEGLPEALQGEVNWLTELRPNAPEAAKLHLAQLRVAFPGEVGEVGVGEEITFALGDPRSEAYPLGVVASLNGEVGIFIRYHCTGTSSIEEAESRLRSVVFDFGESIFFVENLVPHELHVCAFVPCVEPVPGRFTSVYQAIGLKGVLEQIAAALAAVATRQDGLLLRDLDRMATAQLGQGSAIDFCM